MSPQPDANVSSSKSPLPLETLKEMYQKASQSHVFQFYDTLSTTEQHHLLHQLSNLLPPDRIVPTFQQAHAHAKLDVTKLQLQPLPKDSFTKFASLPINQRTLYETLGLQAIQNHQVAIVCLAGGQGTRLGSTAPKGCFPLGLPSQKTLFQLQAERILKLQKLAEQHAGKSVSSGSGGGGGGGNVASSKPCRLPWYIMVSGPTRLDTETFFKSNAYFGLDPKQVTFFEQGTLPAVDEDMKLILETQSKISVAPDGNGGMYDALIHSGVLADMQKHHVKYVHVYCVDNCLVKVGDPVFLGYNLHQQAQVGAKSVLKTSPSEPVGVLCLRDHRYTVVEYSELPKEVAEQRTSMEEGGGHLVYCAANIANHFYTVDFLNSLASLSLPYHVAHKKIQYVDAQGQPQTPSKPNGWKLERFIFDVFPCCQSFAVMEVDRACEFSPLKNKTGDDSPITARRMLMQLHAMYLENAGAIVIGKDNPDFSCEISPLVSYAGEGLEMYKGKTLTSPILIQ
ncbi:UDP-N-acetylglucosamine pyrophosphorylase [Coelomomyces lativittatus]|nr:UDP-N-acetylglucosamine pyrophosphorylase [Coelomomyces lativittatus]KAJ1517318.1 UDP-N-acetylglucosamine pyrophosphorylase [Coelomomyces lativittatus]KAJ1518315.1 UDP-N-acetylglucosamine pyrophosphorylase [Coelomomyces lativittatus]